MIIYYTIVPYFTMVKEILGFPLNELFATIFILISYFLMSKYTFAGASADSNVRAKINFYVLFSMILLETNLFDDF